MGEKERVGEVGGGSERGRQKRREGKRYKDDVLELYTVGATIHYYVTFNTYVWEGKGQVPDGVKGPGGVFTGGAVEGTEQLSHEDPCKGRVLEVQTLFPHDLPLFFDTGERGGRAISYMHTRLLLVGSFSSFLTYRKRKEKKGSERYLSSLVARPLSHCKIAQ